MPITVFPSPSKTGRNKEAVATSSQSLLRETSVAWAAQRAGSKDVENRSILSSSFQDLDSAPVVPLGNALVSGSTYTTH